MAEEAEKYVLLFHHNSAVKTIADFMSRQKIYMTDDNGKVISDASQAADKLFEYNRDFIWQQMDEQDKETIKSENGTYPTSASDLKKTNTLPCPCKIKVESKNITATLSISATNLVENVDDIYAFENEKIQDLYQNDGFVIAETQKRGISPTVFGWFKSLYYIMESKSGYGNAAKDNMTEFADLSRHILSLSTNVGENGGTFSFRLPVIGVEPATAFGKELGERGDSFWLFNTHIVEKSEVEHTNGEEYYAKNSFNDLESNFYNWLISNNDLIFISFEKLEMEKEKEVNFAGFIAKEDEDNFSIETEIANGIYDMIGLVDNVSMITDPASGNAYIEVSGRDLMKLLIEDGSWFFNSSTTTDPSGVFNNESQQKSTGDIVNTNMTNGYTTSPINRIRNIGGEVEIFRNPINMTIEYIIKGLISQLTNIEVVPSCVFNSWGDDRTQFTDFETEK